MLLRSKVVKRLVRHRAGEVLLEFEDGTRLLVDSGTPVEVSITP